MNYTFNSQLPFAYCNKNDDIVDTFSFTFNKK